MENYAIYVHSLKSDCKYFGFTDLANLAYEHEMASKANDIATVEAKYDELMDEAFKVKTLVNEYLGEEEQNDNESESAIDRDIIIVADDSEVIRVFVKKVFDKEYDIQFATNGEEALELIKDHENDNLIKAILLDINMPKVDGFAVLEFLKEKNLFDEMPVTIISGDSSSEAINKAFTFDIVDMITKPFSEEKIKSAIEKTIARKK
jgi:CheY-like chemotaxis protein